MPIQSMTISIRWTPMKAREKEKDDHTAEIEIVDEGQMKVENDHTQADVRYTKYRFYRYLPLIFCLWICDIFHTQECLSIIVKIQIL